MRRWILGIILIAVLIAAYFIVVHSWHHCLQYGRCWKNDYS